MDQVDRPRVSNRFFDGCVTAGTITILLIALAFTLASCQGNNGGTFSCSGEGRVIGMLGQDLGGFDCGAGATVTITPGTPTVPATPAAKPATPVTVTP